MTSGHFDALAASGVSTVRAIEIERRFISFRDSSVATTRERIVRTRLNAIFEFKFAVVKEEIV